MRASALSMYGACSGQVTQAIQIYVKEKYILMGSPHAKYNMLYRKRINFSMFVTIH